MDYKMKLSAISLGVKYSSFSDSFSNIITDVIKKNHLAGFSVL